MSYHIIVNRPGYLPDTDARCLCETFDDALVALRSELEDTRTSQPVALMNVVGAAALAQQWDRVLTNLKVLKGPGCVMYAGYAHCIEEVNEDG